jgi:excisionase family DNA binding protein
LEILPQKAFIDVQDLAKFLGVSDMSIYRLAKEGKLPTPMAFSKQRRWRRSVILQWLEAEGQVTA